MLCYVASRVESHRIASNRTVLYCISVIAGWNGFPGFPGVQGATGHFRLGMFKDIL